MIAVLGEIGGDFGDRSRSGLERRGEEVHPRRREHALSRAFDAVARHLEAASRAGGDPGSREQEADVVVDLRDCSDRRARIPDTVLLAQRQRGRNRRDRVDVRPIDPFQKKPRVGREALHVAPLSFGVEGVENQARLAGAGHPRDHGQLAARNIERDVLEIMGAGTPNTDCALQECFPALRNRPQ